VKVKIIGVGTRMPDWVTAGVDEYQRRLPSEFCPQLIEVPLGARRRGQALDKAIEKESLGLLKHINKGDYVVALDVLGRSMNTEQLAAKLLDWQREGDGLCFLIGGPDGLSSACSERANLRWSLSDLTLPHPLVRIVLMEQIYRAWSVNARHPYHRY
jgi:23S rRNA (pseudouridine1915-N3)-methyltransferase